MDWRPGCTQLARGEGGQSPPKSVKQGTSIGHLRAFRIGKNYRTFDRIADESLRSMNISPHVWFKRKKLKATRPDMRGGAAKQERVPEGKKNP